MNMTTLAIQSVSWAKRNVRLILLSPVLAVVLLGLACAMAVAWAVVLVAFAAIVLMNPASLFRPEPDHECLD